MNCTSAHSRPRGTFESAIEKLDYLREIGITHVELMPVNEFPGNRGWGYDGVDLRASSCIRRPRWVEASRQRMSRKRAGRPAGCRLQPPGAGGNYLGHFGPYFNEHITRPGAPRSTSMAPGSTEVRRFFCDNALMWLRDYHSTGYVWMLFMHSSTDPRLTSWSSCRPK